MSESRNNSESRKLPFPGLKEKIGAKRYDYIQEEKKTLNDIDTLIEELDAKSPSGSSYSSLEYNEALRKRRIKIEELKKLREEFYKKIEEDSVKAIEDSTISDIEKKNEEIDDKINLLKRLLSKNDGKDNNNFKNMPAYSSESRGSSESREEKSIRRSLKFPPYVNPSDLNKRDKESRNSGESRSSGESRW